MTADEVMALIRASDKPHYCYILKRPTGEPFYVGVGTGGRVLNHVSAAKAGRGRDHRLSIIRKALRGGLDIDYEIVAFTAKWQEAAAVEVATIARIGRHDRGEGPLANLTDGGEGTPGRIVDEAERQLRSKIFRGREVGVEQRRALSAISLLNWQNPTIRARNTAATAAAMSKPEVKERVGEASRIAWENPERLASWAETMRERWKNPERREAMIAGRGTPVFFNGTQYASIREAAEAEGYGITTIRRWVAAGRDTPPQKKKRIENRKPANNKRRPPSEETRRKIAETNRGQKRSEEVRRNISAAQRARFERERANGGLKLPHHKNSTPEGRALYRRPVEINGVHYDGTDLAATALDVGRTTIKRWLRAGTHGARRLEQTEAA